MDHEKARLDAATDQKVQETLTALRATARLYTGNQNTDAPQLATHLVTMNSADVLASALANVLLDQVRAEDTSAAFGPPMALPAGPTKTLPADPDATVIDPQPGETVQAWLDEAHQIDPDAAAKLRDFLNKMILRGRTPYTLADDIGPGSGLARYGQRANLADIGVPAEQDPRVQHNVSLERYGYSGRPGGPTHDPDRLAKLFDVEQAACRVCGCTEDYACEGGCAWATDEQIRAAGLEPMDGDVCTACTQRAAACAGVEIRLIGPEPAVRAVQAIMRDSGIPELGERGPFHAVDRDDNAVRVYWATDVNTARRSKNRTRGGRPDRPGKQRGQERRGQ